MVVRRIRTKAARVLYSAALRQMHPLSLRQLPRWGSQDISLRRWTGYVYVRAEGALSLVP